MSSSGKSENVAAAVGKSRNSENKPPRTEPQKPPNEPLDVRSEELAAAQRRRQFDQTEALK